MKEGKKSTVGHCSDYKSLTVLKGLRQNVRIGMKCGAGQNGYRTNYKYFFTTFCYYRYIK
jgi:hypothetical protein